MEFGYGNLSRLSHQPAHLSRNDVYSWRKNWFISHSCLGDKFWKFIRQSNICETLRSSLRLPMSHWYGLGLLVHHQHMGWMEKCMQRIFSLVKLWERRKILNNMLPCSTHVKWKPCCLWHPPLCSLYVRIPSSRKFICAFYFSNLKLLAWY